MERARERDHRRRRARRHILRRQAREALVQGQGRAQFLGEHERQPHDGQSARGRQQGPPEGPRRLERRTNSWECYVCRNIPKVYGLQRREDLVRQRERPASIYCIVMGSENTAAKAFQRWVNSEVLPSIRRLGYYNAASSLTSASGSSRSNRSMSSGAAPRGAAGVPACCSQSAEHPHIHTSTHPHIHTSTHPHIHTSTHPHIHTSTHPHIHTVVCPLRLGRCLFDAFASDRISQGSSLRRSARRMLSQRQS
jgi:hypothetical protein